MRGSTHASKYTILGVPALVIASLNFWHSLDNPVLVLAHRKLLRLSVSAYNAATIQLRN